MDDSAASCACSDFLGLAYLMFTYMFTQNIEISRSFMTNNFNSCCNR